MIRHHGKTLLLYSLSLIGLLQEKGYLCDMMIIMMMMVVIGLMMMIKINFLSGMMAIKNGRPRKHLKQLKKKNIEVFVDSEEQNWFKETHVGNF